MQRKHVKILDTTLRDGQQCPGAGMSLAQNIEYAHLAAKIRIDVLEAGFPSASEIDFKIVNQIADELAGIENSPIVSALCQLRENQIDSTMEALRPALAKHKARVHTYVPVDPNLMIASLGSYAEQTDKILEDIYKLVKKAADAGFEVEFTPEGYSRLGKNFDLATEMICAAIRAGATIINCPDTIGGACKLQGKEYFVEKMNQHAAIVAQQFPDKAITWSAHCHNDFGLALDNSMNAVFFGPATQVEGCFNGLGERGGNVALEQCIMYIKHFGALPGAQCEYYTTTNSQMIQTISDFVAHNMLPRQPHWPIAGENAAKHTSGGHTNAILHNPLAYQPFDPKETGNKITFIFGPMSGSNHAKSIIEEQGYHCEENEKTAIAQYIKNYYFDRRKGVTEAELMKAYFEFRSPIKVTEYSYTKKSGHNILHLVGDFFEQKELEINYQGSDSVLAALHQEILRHIPGLIIDSYHSKAIGKGINAKSQSTIIMKDAANKIYTGVGEDNDIEISALKALIDCANQVYISHHFKISE